MRTASITILATLVLALTARLPAQPPVIKPGPEHEHFKLLEGTWDATVHSKEGNSKGIAMWKVGLGGTWLLEHFKGDLAEGLHFEGMGATTYDPMKKKYSGVWIDTMSTSPMATEGTYDKATKTMTMKSEAPGPDGKMMKMTMISRMVDADNVVFTMNTPGPDGKEFEMLKISYKRKAK